MTSPTVTRHINPRLCAHTEKEFQRLLEYLYQLSRSPWASALVVSSKATKPFMRVLGIIAGSMYCVLPQAYIPRVQYEIEKATGSKIFSEIDMTNSFHQFPQKVKMSQYLAVQTPWGLVEPRFLPDGVCPASAHLQSTMSHSFSDSAIVIFVTVLLLAHDEEDVISKTMQFLDRCEEHNVILKLPKSLFGTPTVNFFGYKVSFGKYKMDEDRKKVINNYVIPIAMKGMQSVMGCVVL